MTRKAHRALRDHSLYLFNLSAAALVNPERHGAFTPLHNAHLVALHYSRTLRPSR